MAGAAVDSPGGPPDRRRLAPTWFWATVVGMLIVLALVVTAIVNSRLTDAKHRGEDARACATASELGTQAVGSVTQTDVEADMRRINPDHAKTLGNAASAVYNDLNDADLAFALGNSDNANASILLATQVPC